MLAMRVLTWCFAGPVFLLAACDTGDPADTDASTTADAAVSTDGAAPPADAGEPPPPPPDACVTQTWYPDVDGDGQGDARSPVEACARPDGYADNGDDPGPDCASNDTDACGECGGPGPRPWYSDADGDGMGADSQGVVACVAPDGWVANHEVYVYSVRPACEEDCNGVVGGFAVVDGCDICVGGDTGRLPSENADCNDECDGEAFLDPCGNCVGGGTGLEPAEECLPDLLVDPDYLRATIQMTVIDADDQCLVDEGCIGALGLRRIIRFGTRIGNVSRADFQLGVPREGVDHWNWDMCHSHFHFEAYADYALIDPETGEPLDVGHKNGFAVIDSGVYDPEIAVRGCRGYNPREQGITAGCQDTYGRTLPCQWIDVTGVPDGVYDVVVTTNPDRVIPEAHYGNNSSRVRSASTTSRGSRCSRCRGASPRSCARLGHPRSCT